MGDVSNDSNTIEQNIRDIQTAIGVPGSGPVLGNQLKVLAVRAIYAGFRSLDWEAYMRRYAKTTKQLRRLTNDDTDCHPYTAPARAYLVGNAVCLPGTDTNLMQGINGFLDETLTDIPGPDTPLDDVPDASQAE